ncbi:hypothetical protein F5Y11DRAFT_361997 [Daldinia sp. FL1419]|nr:hypothetical protein F5Y11DRAFT_361997 [Daldinia sp. FL1419]
MCRISSFYCPNCNEIAQHSFRPCLDMVENEMGRDDYSRRLNEPFVRLYCPNFIWPPVKPNYLELQFCDDCAIKHNRDLPRMVDGPVIEKERQYKNGHREWFMKETRMYEEWSNRLSEEPHRMLILRIPYCHLCKEPSLFLQMPDDVTDRGVWVGIKDVEMELDSTLWKWTWLRQGKEALSCRLVTGFLSKPCSTCLNREEVLRGKVQKFVKKCQPIEA